MTGALLRGEWVTRVSPSKEVPTQADSDIYVGGFAYTAPDALSVVKRSKNKALQGLEGLVVQETAGTFKVVGKDGTVRGESKFSSSRCTGR
jgi:hypothetical protein